MAPKKGINKVRKQVPLVCAFIVLFLLICGCATDSESIVGKWEGITPNKDRITYLFKDDNTLIWTVDSPEQPFSTSAKYSIDYTTSPIQIDIFDFSFPRLNEFLFFGIVEFKGSGKMVLYGEPVHSSAASIKRPQNFGRESVLFERR